jgi:hypothetical protein
MIMHEAIVKIFFHLSKGISEYFVSPLIEFMVQFSTLQTVDTLNQGYPLLQYEDAVHV